MVNTHLLVSVQSKKVVVGADEHSYRLTDCQMGTSYFIRVLALGDKNVELARSKQLTIQTAALPGPPTMTIKDVSGCNVVLKWQQPELFGPTRLIGYKLQVSSTQHAANCFPIHCYGCLYVHLFVLSCSSLPSSQSLSVNCIYLSCRLNVTTNVKR